MEIKTRGYVAKFIRSVDAGYGKGKLILDMPSGGMISVYRIERKWVKARIRGNVAREHGEFTTRQEALNSAAEDFAADSMHIESLIT